VQYANTSQFTYEQFLAFWINTYNFVAVRAILEQPCQYDLFGSCKPLTSIRQIGQQQPGLKTYVWYMPQLKMEESSTMLSLEDVEEKLRCPPNEWPEDPRIHSAIVCASISCPNLQKFAFWPLTIGPNLNTSMTNFLSNPLKGVRLENVTNGKFTTVQLRSSAIFSFYPEDFTNSSTENVKKCNKKPRTTLSISAPWLISQYAPPEIAHWIVVVKNLNVTMDLYFEYDWSLNGNVTTLCNANRPCMSWWVGLVVLFLLIICAIVSVWLYKKTGRSHGYTVVNS